MAKLKIKALLEKIVNISRKNNLRGIAASVGGLSAEEVTIGNGSANCSSYKQILPRGILNTDFDYSTTSGDASKFELVYNSNSTSTVKYPGIRVKQSGLYLVEGTVYFGVGYTAEDRVYITIYINNAVDNRHWFTERMSSTYQIGKLTRLIYLNADDVLELRASNYTSAGRGEVYLSAATRLILTLMNPTI